MTHAVRLATVLDLDGERSLEIVRGVVVEKASATYEHGESQLAVSEAVGVFRGPGGGGGPGGWRIAVEVDIELEAHEI